MNQTTQQRQSKLYIFDFDNTLIRHKETCMQRVPVIAGQVVHALTGECAKKGTIKACQDFTETGDGFASFHGQNHLYWAMHRHFNAIVNFVATANHDPALPHLMSKLSKHANICVASHCTETTLKSAMTILGYSATFIDNHVFGLEYLDGLKSDPTQNILQKICDRYSVKMPEAFLIEDSAKNIRNAEKYGIGGAVLIDEEQTTADFIRLKLQTLTPNKRDLSCLQAS